MELRKKIISILSQSYKTRINNLNQSIELTNNVLDLCKNSNYNDLKAKALSQLSLYYMIIGENDKSSDYSKDSIKIFEELNNEKGIADAKYSIASVYYKTNNYHIGLVFLIDALNIYKKFNDYHNISKCEKSLGTVYEYSEDQESAVQSYENAITAAKKINDLNLESNAYNNLSGVYIK
uniref:tetratricopeptide repeat protein n=1 Tax=Flavobacterium sp. TaxID=239 RepID=UPI003750BC43